MCGLAEIIDFEGGIDAEQVTRVSAYLAHRGPEDVGAWDEPGIALGNRRLSIVPAPRAGVTLSLIPGTDSSANRSNMRVFPHF
jgi:asparagine synthase (glutamine-hydrolysing)